MTELLLRLIEWLREGWRRFQPWHILQEDEAGILMRTGRYHHDLHPGWNWKLPLLDSIRYCTRALDTNLLAKQTLTTADGKTVMLQGIITYYVTDPKAYILDVNEADSVLNDTGIAAIARLAPRFTADQILNGTEFTRALRREARRRARPFGIYVKSVGLADRVLTRAYRLVT